MSRLLLACTLALAACGTSTTPADAGTPVDSGPQSACGHPGDMGNAMGVGQYCQTASDCTEGSGLLCSSLVNNPAMPAQNTFVCIIPQCDPCDQAACGPNAECVCSASLGGCGCFPTSCSSFAASIGGTTTCMDAGSPDADAGTPADAGAVDAGTTDGG